MTREQQGGNPTPQESKPPQDVTFYRLVYGFFRSEQFASYKPNTQTQYKQDLARFLRSAPNGGHIDLPSAIAALRDLKQQQPGRSRNTHKLDAIKATIAWGITQNIVDTQVADQVKQLVTHERHKPTMPLSKTELQRLFAAVSGNTRDRALITTIVITQPTNEELESLKKESVYKDSDGQTVVKIGDKVVPVPEGIAPFIQDYADTLKRESALFPNTLRKDKTIAMTRAGVHVILDKYKRQADLPTLSHKVLVKTGRQLFGKTQRAQTYTPQTPEP